MQRQLKLGHVDGARVVLLSIEVNEQFVVMEGMDEVAKLLGTGRRAQVGEVELMVGHFTKNGGRTWRPCRTSHCRTQIQNGIEGLLCQATDCTHTNTRA